jgi:hypothetical protein
MTDRPVLVPLPTPAGHELRLARALKDDDGSKWLPVDALYDASVGMSAELPAVAMIVAWYTRLPNGMLALKYRCYQEHDRQCLALVTDVGLDLRVPT